MAKMFDGKKVYDRESFSYEQAKIGDYVTEEVVDDAIDCLPPASMTARCSQMGEPISDRFRGEIVQRGKPLVYVGKGQS